LLNCIFIDYGHKSKPVPQFNPKFMPCHSSAGQLQPTDDKSLRLFSFDAVTPSRNLSLIFPVYRKSVFISELARPLFTITSLVFSVNGITLP